MAPLKVLSSEEIDAIHKSTLDVLEHTGLRIEHKKALQIFEENGCKVDYDTMRVRIPSAVTEDCIRKCPTSFRIKARDPENDMIIGGNSLHVTTFPGMQTVDLETWEPRDPTRSEFYDAVKVLDALENIHYMGNYIPWFGFEGVPPVMCIPEGFAARARNSSKVLKCGYSNDSEIFTIKIAQAVGSETMISCMASAPLTLYTEAIESLMRGIEAGFPVITISGGVMGGSVPATIAGSTVVNNAEVLGPAVLAQLIRPGSRVMVENLTLAQNMRSGIPAFGAIEISLHNAVFCQYFKSLGIPTQIASTGPVSAKTPDFQCGYEKALLAIIAALSGAHIIYLCGSLFGELTFHPIQAVLDNDLSGIVGRFIRGVEINQDTIALDLINEIGPIPGFYLDKQHTRDWWKKEHFVPRVADRLSIAEWKENGKRGAFDYAKDRVQDILSTYKPKPLTQSQEEEVEEIINEAREFYQQKNLI
jgi:trimethylamine--corrinoid protein Co-methyltransferase